VALAAAGVARPMPARAVQGRGALAQPLATAAATVTEAHEAVGVVAAAVVAVGGSGTGGAFSAVLPGQCNVCGLASLHRVPSQAEDGALLTKHAGSAVRVCRQASLWTPPAPRGGGALGATARNHLPCMQAPRPGWSALPFAGSSACRFCGPMLPGVLHNQRQARCRRASTGLFLARASSGRVPGRVSAAQHQAVRAAHVWGRSRGALTPSSTAVTGGVSGGGRDGVSTGARRHALAVGAAAASASPRRACQGRGASHVCCWCQPGRVRTLERGACGKGVSAVVIAFA
jgi:hypothetical protein